MSRVKRVPRSGADSIVSVPAHPSLFSDHDRMLQHHRRYRPPELRALLGRHLDVVDRGSVFASLLAPRALSVLAEICGEEQAQIIQLALEYAPDPPFNAGRPEIAPEAVRAHYEVIRQRMMPSREAEARAAAEMTAE